MKLKLITFLCCIQMFIVSAQDNTKTLHYDNILLTKVLSDIEREFQVTFAYNALDISQKVVSLHIENPTIEKFVVFMEANYQVSFSKIDAQYYSITTLDEIEICGYLKDAIDGSPVTSASIINLKKGTGTTSNNNGYFNINNNAISDTIVISYLGFKTLKIPAQTIRNKNCNTFVLLSENVTLNEVVIQDYLSSGVVKTNDGAIKLKPNNLDVLAGQAEPDVLQTIQLLPGVESPNENATGLHIRGGSPDQNLLLWDGIKMYNADHFFGMLSALNSNITESVRFYRSGANPIYGDRIAGVIDIKTKSKITEKLKGGVGINATHADAYLHIPVTKQTGLLVSAKRSLTDVMRTPTTINFGDSVFQNTSIIDNQDRFHEGSINEDGRFYFFDTTLKLNSKLSEKDKLSASGIYTENKLNYNLDVENFNEDATDNLSIINYGSNLTWNRQWTSRFASTSEFYISNYELNYFGVNPFLAETLTTTKTNTIREFGLKLHTEYKLNSKYSLINGYSFFENRVSYTLKNLDFNDIDDRSNPTHSFYSGFNYRNLNKWNIDIGFRSEYYTILERVFFEPRINIEHTFNDYARLNFTAELRNQAISQILEFASLEFGLENQVWTLVDDNNNLLLKSDQLSLGFSYNRNGWKFDTDLYYKNIEGFTSFTKSFATVNTTNDFSEGISTILGIDVLLKKRINNYSSWLGYTYSHNTFRFDDLNQGNSFRANNNSKHSLTWSHAYKWNNFQLSLGWKFRTGIPFTNAKGIENDGNDLSIIYENVNAETLPNYHRLDASIVYGFNWAKTTKVKIGLSLLNLYDRKNILNRTFSIFQYNNEQDNLDSGLQTINRKSLGFTPNFFLRMDF